MKKIINQLVIIFIILLLSACSDSNSNKSAQGLFLPPTGFIADVNQGRELFNKNCSHCHGADIRGTKQGPPLLHKIYESSHHSNMSFYRAVSRGTHQHHWQFGNMPPVKNVTASEAGHIIGYIRKEQRRAGIK